MKPGLLALAALCFAAPTYADYLQEEDLASAVPVEMLSGAPDEQSPWNPEGSDSEESEVTLRQGDTLNEVQEIED